MQKYSTKLISSIAGSLWAQLGTHSPFFTEWFGASKAVDGGGPKQYFASASRVASFEPKDQSSGLGIILSADASSAGAYDSDIEPFFVSIQNPYTAPALDFPLSSDQSISQFREELTSKGFDGMVMPNGSVIAFERQQLLPVAGLDYSRSVIPDDLFPGEFADKAASVSRSEVVSSKGDRVDVLLGNVDSTGQRITSTMQGLENFWNGFYGTAAVDDEGRPLRLYHSTSADIAEFKLGMPSVNDYGLLGTFSVSRAGHFLSSDLSFSEEYLKDGDGQNVMPVYLNLQNPLDLRAGVSEDIERDLERIDINPGFVHGAATYWELFDLDDDGKNKFVDSLKAGGFDGVIFREDRPSGEGEAGVTYMAFESSQIKSAIGNIGLYDISNDDIRYRRGGQGGILKADVQTMIARVSENWKSAPPIKVVQSVSDMPIPVHGDAAGLLHNGHTFLIADNLANIDHAEFVLMHEVIGHYGLAGLLGSSLNETMLQIYADNENVRVKADVWMNTYSSTNVALATEEALSDLAANMAEIKGFGKFVGLMRSGLRSMGFKLPMSDLDVSILLQDSRKLVEKESEPCTLSSLITRYRRVGQAMTKEFKSWFCDSKVVDGQGSPLVVYHGTSADFEVFNTDGRGKTTGAGASFSSSPDVAGTYTNGFRDGNIMPVYLSLQAPAVFDCAGANWSRIGKSVRVRLPRVEVSDQEDEQLMADLFGGKANPLATKTLKERSTTLGKLFPGEFLYDDDFISTDSLAEWARKAGYDGAIFLNIVDRGPSGALANEKSQLPANVYVAFRPDQVKSAISNIGDYSVLNPDIRYSRASKPEFESSAVRDWLASDDVVKMGDEPLCGF